MKRQILIFLSIFSLAVANDYGATNLYKQIKSFYGSKEGLRNNVSKPATGATDFKTLKGDRFKANISCPSSLKAVVIDFNPLTGNEYKATIKVDSDLDKVFDYFYTTPNISGVCNNGIVSCQTGTWNNCKYYYWDISTGQLKLTETQDTSKTGPCSCSNISCGINNLETTLFALLGGGVSNALSKLNPRLAISKSKWNGNSLELFGYNSQNCSTPNTNLNSYGEKNPVNYYNSQTQPNVSIIDIANQQANDPYSPYSIIQPITQAEYDNGKSIGMPSYQECTIRRIVVRNETTRYENCQTITWNSRKWCLIARRVNNQCSNCKVSINTPVDIHLKPSQSLVAIFYGHHSICDDDSSIGFLKYSGDFSGQHTFTCMSIRYGKVVYIANNVDGYKNIRIENFYQRHYGGGGDWDVYRIELLKSNTYKEDNFSISTINNCPTNCTLIDEWICDKDGKNCIQTVDKANPLNVSIKKQCFNYTTNLSSYVICSDGNTITVSGALSGTKQIGSGWFYIKRKYNCGTQNIDIDLSKTMQVIQSTENPSGQEITYVDPNTGQTENIKYSLDVNNCPVPVCTVEIPNTDTQVFVDDTNKSQIPGGTPSKSLEVRTCEKNGNIYICPINSGEKLLEGCKCSLDRQEVGFRQSITSLKIIEEATKDMICSNSPP